jgi:hypothetical protein
LWHRILNPAPVSIVMLEANPQIGHANMPSPQSEIERSLRSGEHDPLFGAWPVGNVLECARRGDADLRRALVEVKARAAAVSYPRRSKTLIAKHSLARRLRQWSEASFRSSKSRRCSTCLLAGLPHSNYHRRVLNRGFPSTAWDLATLYLLSCGAEPLADDAPRIVGMSEDTTRFVSMDYFRATHRFADFVVHEAAHVFRNCKRRTLGLPATRRREWLLEIASGKRETFACACEAYSGILELGDSVLARCRLYQELEREAPPPDELVCHQEYVDILRSAVCTRNGWTKILSACAPPRTSRTRSQDDPV